MQRVDRKLDESSRFYFFSPKKSHSCVSGKFVATEILWNTNSRVREVHSLIMRFDDFRRVEYTHKNTSCRCQGRKLWTSGLMKKLSNEKKSSNGSSDRRRLFCSSLRRNRLQVLFCHCSKLRWINHICRVTLALSSMEPGMGRRGLIFLWL